MALDADIAAADALTLEKIKAQDYRALVASTKAHQLAMQGKLDAFIAWMKEQYDALPPETDPLVDLRRRMALTIADKYFTTGTATLPESVQVDAANDARRFKAALDAAVACV